MIILEEGVDVAIKKNKTMEPDCAPFKVLLLNAKPHRLPRLKLTYSLC